MSIDQVTVRMYRNLLGDCFLIRISESDGNMRHILIDCGLLQGLKDSGKRMRAVAADIVETSGGLLDLVVVTHEHWDHLSGFAQAKELLLDPEKLRIGQLWLAWTENPEDPQANALRARFEKRSLALSAFAADSGDEELLDGLENFIGPRDPPGNEFGAAPTGRLTGRRVLEELKTLAGRAGVRYLEPGQVVGTPGNPPLAAAVLGPPRTEQRLFKDLPSSGDAKETYLDEEMLGQSFSGQQKSQSPFAAGFSEGLDAATVEQEGAAAEPGSARRLLHDRYFARRDPDDRRAQTYRRIDNIWSETAASLALKLDSDTNNTSLVLAFRLPDDSFLLFAADAQVGNWLSWHDQDYDFDDERLSATDILGRTRLYKVGHHGSHNATLRMLGLEQMTAKDLVAMIPTVEAEARVQGRKKSDPENTGWRMPDENLLAALQERCQGRVVMGDRRWKEQHDATRHGKQQAFAKMLDESSDLFVDFHVFRRKKSRRPRGEGG